MNIYFRISYDEFSKVYKEYDFSNINDLAKPIRIALLEIIKRKKLNLSDLFKRFDTNHSSNYVYFMVLNFLTRRNSNNSLSSLRQGYPITTSSAYNNIMMLIRMVRYHWKSSSRALVLYPRTPPIRFREH